MSRAASPGCPAAGAAVAVLFGYLLAWANGETCYEECAHMPLGLCSLEECGDVLSMPLQSRNLTGTIPPFLGSLLSLRSLSLANNSLSGPVPASFQTMANLEILDLEGNKLSGTVPSFFGSLPNITHLNLLGNYFTGTVPAALGSLHDTLEVLDMSQNRLTGALPSSMCYLQGARVLFNNVWCQTEYAIHYENVLPMADAAAGWVGWVKDAQCGIEPTSLGTFAAVVPYDSIDDCPNTVYQFSTALATGANPPWQSFLHFRDLTTCNIHGELRLQHFECPLPASCSSWLQHECGVGTCLVPQLDETNFISGTQRASVGGGKENTAAGASSTVGGGKLNAALGDFSVVSGGFGNKGAAFLGAVVAGGVNNTATAALAVVGGGQNHNVSGPYAVIAGGSANSALAEGTFVGGGRQNLATGLFGAVAGGDSNSATNSFATIGGGFHNTASKRRSTVGGGAGNQASGDSSTIAGGRWNAAYDSYSLVGGGFLNRAHGDFANVVGGERNSAVGVHATISGGYSNFASGSRAFIGGGSNNTASGYLSFVSGGYASTAEGAKSAAVGHLAHAEHPRSMVFGFSERACRSTGNGTVNFCTDGGVFVDGVRLDNVSIAVPKLQSQIIDLDTNVSSRWHQLTLEMRKLETLERNTSAALALLQLHTLQYTDELVEADTSIWAGLENVNSSLQEVLECCSNVANANETLRAMANLSIGYTMQSARIAELEDTVASLESKVLAQSTTIASQNESLVTQQQEFASLVANFSALSSVVAALVEGASFAPTTMTADMGTTDLASTVDCLADSDPCTGSTAVVSVPTTPKTSSTATQYATTEEETGHVTGVERSNESSIQSGTTTVLPISSNTTSSTPPLSGSEVVSAVTTVPSVRSVSTMNTNTLAQSRSSNSTINRGYSTTTASASSCDGGAPCDDKQASTRISRSTPFLSSRPSVHAVAQVTTPSTSFTEANVTLTLCQADSCVSGFQFGDDPAVVFWSWPLVVVASPSFGTGRAVSHYYFRLTNAEGVLKWLAQPLTNETSFLPSEHLLADEIGGQRFNLEVTVGFLDGYTAVSTVSVVFTSAPVIHQLSLIKLSSEPGSAVSRYTLFINASSDDNSTLSYDLQAVGFPMHDWEHFIAAFTAEGVVTELFFLPSTRSASILVTVTNKLGISTPCTLEDGINLNGASDVHCPIASVSATGTTQAVLAELEDTLAVGNATGGEIVSLLLASTDLLHSTENDTLVEQLSQAFVNIVTEPSHEISIFQSVEVLAELVVLTSSSSNSTGLLLVAIESIGHSLQGLDLVAHVSAAQQFVDVVGQFASDTVSNNDVAIVSILDNALAAACGTSQSGHSEMTFDETEMFTLSCFGSGESEFAAGATESGAVLVGSSAHVSMLTISSWNHNDLVESTNMLLLSNMYGIHAQSSAGELAPEVGDIGDAYELSFQLRRNPSDTSVEALRKTVSCDYYDPNTGFWSSRGVFLKGMQLAPLDQESLSNASSLVAGGLQLSVLCSSTHLTLFSVTNNSETTQIIEAKINALSKRVDEIGGVDFSDPSAQINWIVMTVFGATTLVFVLVVVVTKLAQRDQAVATARKVFTQRGKLERSVVIGSTEYEAILRGWLPAWDIVRVFVLELLTSNAFLGIFFRWDHEALVFSRADKAMDLYAAMLMTFLSSAFFFDTGSSDDSAAAWSPEATIFAIFVSAMASNLLLLPVEHILPYMTIQVNSLESSTPRQPGLISNELKRLARKCGCLPQQNKQVERRTGVAKVVGAWTEFAAGQREERGRSSSTANGRVGKLAASSGKAHDARADGVLADVDSTLRFLSCQVQVPSCHVSRRMHRTIGLKEMLFFKKIVAQRSPQTLLLSRGVLSLQRAVRYRQWHFRRARELEFDVWLRDHASNRRLLATLSVAVLVVLASFTLTICLLLSGAFSNEECGMWAVDVAQSAAMQIFVTHPILGLMTLVGQLAASWLLLRLGQRHQVVLQAANLKQRESDTLRRQLGAANLAAVLEARRNALLVIASNNADLIRSERQAFESTLQTSKTRLAQLRESGFNASQSRLFEAEERALQTKVQAANAALQTLHLFDGNSKQSVGESASGYSVTSKTVSVALADSQRALANVHLRMRRLDESRHRLAKGQEHLAAQIETRQPALRISQTATVVPVVLPRGVSHNSQSPQPAGASTKQGRVDGNLPDNRATRSKLDHNRVVDVCPQDGFGVEAAPQRTSISVKRAAGSPGSENSSTVSYVMQSRKQASHSSMESSRRMTSPQSSLAARSRRQRHRRRRLWQRTKHRSDAQSAEIKTDHVKLTPLVMKRIIWDRKLRHRLNSAAADASLEQSLEHI